MCCRERDDDDADQEAVEHAEPLGNAHAAGRVFVDVRDGDDAHAEERDAETCAVEPPQTDGDLGLGFQDVLFGQVVDVGVFAVGC